MASDAAIEGVSGAAGAVMALLATYPLLTVSTLKALKHKQKDEASESRGNGYGSIHEIKELITNGGWTSLYTGLKPAVLGTALSQGVYFCFYSALRQAAVARAKRRRGGGERAAGSVPLPQSDGKSEDIGVAASLLVASVAGAANVLLTNPVWVVVTQMQASHKYRSSASSASDIRDGGGGGSTSSRPPANAWAIAKELYSEKGILGLWQGVVPSLVMVSNPTITYVLYEWLVARAARLRSLRLSGGRARGAPVKMSALDIFLLSAVAKLGATLATYPLLLVKNRLQALNRHTEAEMRYVGVLDAVQRIWAQDGVGGFYKGIDTKLVQTVLAAALLMVMKETIYDATHAALRPGGAAPTLTK